MATYQFDVEHATRWGVNEAIFLHNLLFWLRKNKAEARHHHDGRTWTFSTTIALAQLYPFWKTHQVRYVIDSLKRQEVLLTGHYGADRFDRTLWFAVADESLLELPDITPAAKPAGDSPETRFAKFRKSRREKSQIDVQNSAVPNKEPDVQPVTDRQPEKQTLNVGATLKTSKPSPEGVGSGDSDHDTEAVRVVVSLTGDTHSLRRFAQLRDICTDHAKTGCWTEALRSTERAIKRGTIEPQKRGAYFCTAVVRQLERKGVTVPSGTPSERGEVRGLISASLNST